MNLFLIASDTTAVDTVLHVAKSVIPAEQQVVFYRALLDSQEAIADRTINYLVGILGVFALVSIGYNVWLYKIQISFQLKNALKTERAIIKNEITEEYETKLNKMQGELAMTNAYLNDQADGIITNVYAVQWWQTAITHFLKIHDSKRIKTSASRLASSLESAVEHRMEFMNLFNGVKGDIDSLKELVDLIPETEHVEKEAMRTHLRTLEGEGDGRT